MSSIGIYRLIYHNVSSREYQDNSLESLAGCNQAIDTADVARPPSHRTKIARRLVSDVSIQQTVHNTGNRIPNTNGVDCLIGNTGIERNQNCIT
jgi:hypothetical protein